MSQFQIKSIDVRLARALEEKSARNAVRAKTSTGSENAEKNISVTATKIESELFFFFYVKLPY